MSGPAVVGRYPDACNASTLRCCRYTHTNCPFQAAQTIKSGATGRETRRLSGPIDCAIAKAQLRRQKLLSALIHMCGNANSYIL
jgi:hypothetical protein